MQEQQQTLRRLQDAGFQLQQALAPIVEERMKARYGAGWAMYASRPRGADPKGRLDLYGMLKTLIANWNDVFEKAMPAGMRTQAYLALEGRNAAAHPAEPITHDAAISWLRAHHELAKAVKAPQSAELKKLLEAELQAVSPAPAALPEPAAAPHSAARQPTLDIIEPDRPGVALKPWREVSFPRVDVIESRFQDAEYAADLSAVDRGIAPEEYGTPAGFFRMTHATVGLRRVLKTAVDRLTDQGGDPVIGLQTTFGGGKTHTLLALFHLAGAENPADLPILSDIVPAGTEWIPTRSAVFVGFAVGPDVPFFNEGGRTIRTVWGWIAWKLLGADGLALVQEAETAGTSPGSVALEALLKKAAPCVVLLDEIVAYVRQLDGQRFESHLTFFQELTEAAKNVPGVLVVGSLPESLAEVGGAKGQEALRRLEKIFGRIQSAWLPASGVETYEIVRRRLFEPLDGAGERARDQTIKAFHELYRRNSAEFPPQAKEAAYLEELRACYPIHPELLGRLAKDWSGLEKFQRTRGVLKLMAHIIATLWRGDTKDPMILPGRVPLRDERVRASILVPVEPGYGAVLDREVEGDTALPAQMEANPSRNITRARAATRVARSLFICSVPSASQANKGITGQDVRLACAEPGDQLDVFGNALREFTERAAYLYEEAGRYWFSTQPTLNKLADDRARAYSPEEVNAAIVMTLKEEQARKGSGFARVHAALDVASEAEDGPEVSLIILGPAAPHAGRGAADSDATRAATDVVLRKGVKQRTYRNAIVFLAADVGALDTARLAMRRALAWGSIVRDADQRLLELTGSQHRDAQDKAGKARAAAAAAVRSAWTHGLVPVPVPVPEPESENKTALNEAPCTFDHVSVRSSNGKGLAEAAWERFCAGSTVYQRLGWQTFWSHLGPHWPADQPHLSSIDVADWFARYVYLPRLRDRVVLATTIDAAVASTDPPFAVARLQADGTYADVVLRRSANVAFAVDEVLLRREIAEGLLTPTPQTPAGVAGSSPSVPPPNPAITPPQPATKVLRRFFATVDLDPARPVARIGAIVDGVLSELQRPHGATIRLVLEIHADAPDGFPDDVVTVVRDNAKTLGFASGTADFSEE
ncbi:MAG: DUF499 domain-containing protein [Rhodospirillales bacterium]